MLGAVLLGVVACTNLPTLTPPPTPTSTPTPTRTLITLELEVKSDPSEAADFVLNPKPITGGRYLLGRTVTIDVLPKEGWRIDKWVGPVYGIVGNTGKIDMSSSQTVIIRLVRLEAARQTPMPVQPTPTHIPPTPTPTPVPPTSLVVPTPTPIKMRPLAPVPTVPTDDYNLSTLLPTLPDLAPGAIIEGDGYVQDTDALSAYEREFEAEGLFFALGSS